MSRSRKIVSLLSHGVLFLYVLLSGLAIFLLSMNDYKWMVGERDTDGTILTLCALPVPSDDTSDVALIVTLITAFPLLIFGVARLVQRRQGRLPLVLCLGLLALWGYCVGRRTLSCWLGW
jgi:hypothetical protein